MTNKINEDNLIELPIIYKDTPNEVLWVYFLKTDGDVSDNDDFVFFYVDMHETENSLRLKYDKANSGEEWYIPTDGEIDRINSQW